MLMPIIAAVGSFVVSERILKPKGVALFVLACLAVYDVFVSPPRPIAQRRPSDDDGSGDEYDGSENDEQSELDEFWDYDSRVRYRHEETEDDLVASMRCYRGPALLAVALFCSAFSLRMWRRNGVACDELIFLPGTPHEFRCAGGGGEGGGGEKQSDNAHERKNSDNMDENEGGENDGGDDDPTNDGGGEAGRNSIDAAKERISPIKSCFSEGDAAAGAAKSSLAQAQREVNRPISRSLGTLETGNLDSSLDADVQSNAERERMPLALELEAAESHSGPNSPSKPRARRSPDRSPAFLFIREQALRGLDMLVVSRPGSRPTSPNSVNISPGESSAANATLANNEVYDAEYAPSAPSVLGAALDLSLPVLFNFHMFVVLMKDHYRKEVASEVEEETTQADDAGDAKVDVKDDTWMRPPQVPPKVLPLFFITPLIIRSMVPPRQRRRFYRTVLQGTVLSPFRPVRFRDAFVADCVTSVVRPVVDLVYALAYYVTAIFGLLSGKYNLNQAGSILSKSMVWHGLIMPTLSILPLFVKFLQTLRQAYDTGKRWPYLGNSFKYLTAGLVILYGMTHAEGERSVWWRRGFIAATVYQIVWDSVVDWELLVFVPREPPRKRSPITITSLCRLGRDALPQIRLRSKRLFDDDSFYWKALLVNAALRFCWMTGFIPAYWVSISTGSTQVTFVDRAHGWSFVLLATLEIFRRSIWGIIKVELETIKLTGGEENDLAMASITEEYLREGSWKVPCDALDSNKARDSRPTCLRLPKGGKDKWRLRLGRIIRRAGAEEDAKAGGLDSNQIQYSKLEQAEPTAEPASPSLSEAQKGPVERRRHRWLCVSVGGGFLRWLYVVELLLWIAAFLVASYYVILAE